ncbi:hypothetical protein V6N13_024179 [Hibiscus sabdariffa]|uniref:Uncharacterized protein n=1 Tax=Hibiscus sabdariffa TaxID=183260 RepID=A0ABR2BWQ6_9ROSI
MPKRGSPPHLEVALSCNSSAKADGLRRLSLPCMQGLSLPCMQGWPYPAALKPVKGGPYPAISHHALV